MIIMEYVSVSTNGLSAAIFQCKFVCELAKACLGMIKILFDSSQIPLANRINYFVCTISFITRARKRAG